LQSSRRSIAYSRDGFQFSSSGAGATGIGVA